MTGTVKLQDDRRAYSVRAVSEILLGLEPILAPDVAKIELLGLARGRLQLRFHGRGAERFSADDELKQAIELVFKDTIRGISAVDITIAGQPGVAPEQTISAIDRTMNLGVIAASSTKAAEILTDWGLHCIGCFANTFDTVETGAKLHGMSETEIDDMVAQVNQALAK